MQKWRQWESAPDSEWSVAVEREAVIRPLAELNRLSQTAVDHAVELLGLGRTSIYGLVRRYKQRPQTSSLLPFKRGRDTRTFFLDKKSEDLIAACISEFYLTPQRPSLAALLREIRRRFYEKQLPPPNYRTVRRRLEALDARQIVQKREGAKAARTQFGPVKHLP